MSKNYTNPETQKLKEAFEKNELLNEYLFFDAYVKENYTPEHAIDALLKAIGGVPVIYSTEAMDFLTKHDLYLTESLELARELGYKELDQLIKLGSEGLANLLLQDMLKKELEKLIK
jgi:hypothetical protein